jgi:cysteine desulfurase
MEKRIYLDNCATTPVHPSVIAAMNEAFLHFGNPSSQHKEGRKARALCEEARQKVARLLAVPAASVMFTSGGTESNHTALTGLAALCEERGLPKHIVTTPIEHPSVLKTVNRLAEKGFRTTFLPLDRMGRMDLQSLKEILHTDRASIVSVTLVQHEIGNLYPVAELAHLAMDVGAFLHCDAVQASGKIPLHSIAPLVSTLSLSAHKFCGPKGVGVLAVGGPKSGEGSLLLPSVFLGGGQEHGRRAGTENVPGICGLGACAQLAMEKMLPVMANVAVRRQRLEAGLRAVGNMVPNGDPEHVCPTILNVRAVGIPSDLLMQALDLEGIAVSTGAACSSGKIKSSSVLRALSFSEQEASESVRFSLSFETTDEEIDQTIKTVERVTKPFRVSPPKTGLIQGLG